MQSGNGGFLQVDGLDDIDLAAVWPVRAARPLGWPDAAGITWHMGDIGNEEAGGEVIRGFHPDGFSAIRCVLSYAVGTEIHLAVPDAC